VLLVHPSPTHRSQAVARAAAACTLSAADFSVHLFDPNSWCNPSLTNSLQDGPAGCYSGCTLYMSNIAPGNGGTSHGLLRSGPRMTQLEEAHAHAGSAYDLVPCHTYDRLGWHEHIPTRGLAG